MSSHLFAWLGSRRVVLAHFVALLAAAVIASASRGTDWLGSWKMALDWGTFSVTLVGPVAAGMACAVYVRMAQAGVSAISLTSTRPLRAWLQPAVAVWTLAAGAVVIICLSTTLAATIAGSSAVPSSYWVVIPALCVLAANVAVGVYLGAVGTRRWLVPVAATVSFMLGVLSASGVVPHVFRTGGVTGPMIGETWAVNTMVLQAVASLGVAVVLCWTANVGWARTSVAALVAGALVVAPAAVACAALAKGDYERYSSVEGPLRLECEGSSPQVCLAAETSRSLDDLAKRVDQRAKFLIQAGVELPDRFVQTSPYATREQLGSRDGVIQLFVDEQLDGSVNDEIAVRALTMPRLCPQFVSEVGPPQKWFAVKRLLGRWMLSRDGTLNTQRDDVDAKWLSLPLEQQRQWLTKTYAQLTNCDIESVGLPW